ncbi:phage tail tube protein [Halorussus salinus]|uniref:phage tail tube protein n=1 Tax=Halorussus salinus TaxID=1364935 RepID=UPI0010930634|nr:phage tail tube protein [Halorussus salinus]
MPTGTTTRIAYLHEPTDDYMGSPTDTDYKTPGLDCVVEEIGLDNALRRMRTPGDAETTAALAGNFSGAITVSFTLANPWWKNHVFGGPPTANGESSAPYAYDWSVAPGEVQSSRWYTGIDYSEVTAERVLKGVVFSDMQVNLTAGEPVEVTLTGFYGDEETNATLTPGSQPSEQATPLRFHGGSLSIPDSSTVNRVQSASLSMKTGARPQTDTSRHPVAAVMGAVETTLNVRDVVTDTDQLELAYGGSSAPETAVDGASAATLDLSSPDATGLTYDLSGVTPDTYSWEQWGDLDADAIENTTYVVNSVTATAESDQSEAR